MYHHQFNIQQLYALPTLYLCVLYLSENKSDLCHLLHKLIGFYNFLVTAWLLPGYILVTTWLLTSYCLVTFLLLPVYFIVISWLLPGHFLVAT